MTPEAARSERAIPIADGAIGEQARKTMTHSVEDSRLAANVEIGVVLAGETCVRQIFGGRRRAHGHGEFVAIFGGEFRERCANISLHRRRRHSRIDDFARPRRPARQILDIIWIETIKRRM